MTFSKNFCQKYGICKKVYKAGGWLYRWEVLEGGVNAGERKLSLIKEMAAAANLHVTSRHLFQYDRGILKPS